MLLLARVASADDVALVSSDRALAASLTDAGNHVIVTTDPAPPMDDLAPRSKEIAAREGAHATVWLTATGATSMLVTYDAGSDRLTVRALPYAPPLDAAQAAETARMVRTMIDSLRVVEVTPPPLHVEAPVTPPIVIEHEPQLAVAIGAGVWLAAPAATAQPSATVFAAWRPHGLGVAVSGTLAPSATVAMSSFTGDVSDVIVAVQARNALAVAPRLYVVPAAGAALHMVHVAGDTLDSRRFDPAGRIGLTAVYDLAHGLDASLDVSADCLLRRQRYEAGSTEILTVPRVQIVTALMVGIRL
jgi:hypothetical protein